MMGKKRTRNRIPFHGRTVLIGLFCLFALFSAGCGGSEDSFDPAGELISAAGEGVLAVQEAVESGLDTLKGAAESGADQLAGMAADTLSGALSIPAVQKVEEAASGEDEEPDDAGELAVSPLSSWYHYDSLSQDQQEIYLAIYARAEAHSEEEVRIPDTDAEEISRIMEKVLYDNPDIFWVNTVTLYSYVLGERTLYETISVSFTMTQEERKQREEKVLAAAEEILTQVPADADDYTKVKYIFTRIADDTEYELGAEDNQNICSVLLNHASVCQGYALTAQYLLTQLGVQAITVSGTADGVPHAWNIVWADGESYHMDVTWGDPEYLDENGEESQREHEPNYQYMLIPDELLGESHRADAMFTVPECTALTDNYFMREGSWFEGWSSEQFIRLAVQTIEEGRDTFSFYCADDAAAAEVLKELEGQHIFALLKQIMEKTGAGYSTSQFMYNLDEESRIGILQFSTRAGGQEKPAEEAAEAEERE